MTLLEFARGPAAQASTLILIAGIIWRLTGILLLPRITLVLAFLVMTYFHVVVGEVGPKNLAIDRADRLAVLVAPALLFFCRISEPFVWIVEKSSAAVARRAKTGSASSSTR